MERKKLDIQQPSVVIPGETTSITLHDIARFADTTHVDTASKPLYLTVETSEILDDVFDTVRVFIVNNQEIDNDDRQLIMQLDLHGTPPNVWDITNRMFMHLHDDDDRPIYTDASRSTDDTSHSAGTIHFGDSESVHYWISEHTVSVYTDLPSDEPSRIPHSFQYAARVASASIDAIAGMSSITPEVQNDIVISVPDDIEPAQSYPAPLESPTLETIGGSFGIKQQLVERAEMFHDRHDETLKNQFGIVGNKPFMLYGPPGTGKTAMAEGFAELINAEFEAVDLTILVDKYLGESAKHVKEVFENAKAASVAGPRVLFIDEFDSVSKAKEDLHDEYQKMVNILKLEITDTIKHYPNLVILRFLQELLR